MSPNDKAVSDCHSNDTSGTEKVWAGSSPHSAADARPDGDSELDRSTAGLKGPCPHTHSGTPKQQMGLLEKRKWDSRSRTSTRRVGGEFEKLEGQVREEVEPAVKEAYDLIPPGNR